MDLHSPAPSKATALSKRHACDECYLRKVRCDRQIPCSACVEAKHSCTHTIKRKRMGPPKGSGKVNARLRLQTQIQSSISPQSTPTMALDYFSSGDELYVSPLERTVSGGPNAEYPLLHHTSPPRSLPSETVIDQPLPLEQAAFNGSSFHQLLQPQPQHLHPSPGHALIHGTRVPLKAYLEFLGVYQHKLYPIWPVVSVDALTARLQTPQFDAEAYALAASLCAATISQLRLKEHAPKNTANVLATSQQFATEAQIYRGLYDFYESDSLDTLLSSFFLHVYFANAHKIRTSGFYLREAVGFALSRRIYDANEFTYSSQSDERRLCIYWILFVSERTFGVQNKSPIVLKPVEHYPRSDMSGPQDAAIVSSFSDLARLFTLIQGSFTQALQDVNNFSPSSQAEPFGDMMQLNNSIPDRSPNEVQKVDVAITRNWIQTMFWRYGVTQLSARSSAKSLSSMLPFYTALEAMNLLANASPSAIHAHGYGMEMKVFQIVDALIDVVPSIKDINGCLSQFGEGYRVVDSLRGVLSDLGGNASDFVRGIDKKIVETGLSQVLYAAPLAQVDVKEYYHQEEDEDAHRVL